MKQYTNDKIIASFPAKFTPQMPIRKVWLRTKKCPVYFYTQKSIQKLLKSANLSNFKIVKISAGYFVIASIKETISLIE